MKGEGELVEALADSKCVEKEKAGVLKSVRGRRPYWWNLYITLDVMDGRSLQDPGPEAVTIK